MTRGYRNSIGDADDQYDPDIVGDGPSAPFMRGADGSATRYAAARYGQPGAAIGVRDQNGNDMGPQWCKKGTASYAIAGLNGRTFNASITALTNESQVYASVTLSLKNDGTWSAVGNTNRGTIVQPSPNAGSWLTNGAVGDHQVQMDVLSSSGNNPTVSNSAPSWASLSANQTIQLMLPSYAANNSVERNGAATVRIRLRKAATGAVISDNTVYLSVSTTGWV